MAHTGSHTSVIENDRLFRNNATRQLDSLYDLIGGAHADTKGGYETDYAGGICHTLRLLGMFTQEDINRWSETRSRIAYIEMLETALRTIETVLPEIAEQVA